jgi:hypothetical protein
MELKLEFQEQDLLTTGARCSLGFSGSKNHMKITLRAKYSLQEEKKKSLCSVV